VKRRDFLLALLAGLAGGACAGPEGEAPAADAPKDEGDNVNAKDAPAGGKATGLVYDEKYLEHDQGRGHPERPERLKALLEGLEEAGLREKLVDVAARAAELEWLTKRHDAGYVERVKKTVERAPARLDTDVSVSAGSYEAALLAAGGVLAACDAVMAGKVRNAFCAVRPPGHHALRANGMGFCIFGNVAIAAAYLREKHKVARVAIADWDVHHGNGTQAMTYEDPLIYFTSSHRFPFYPGTGDADERGKGDGAGFTLNLPYPGGTADEHVLKLWREKWLPEMEKFKPEFILMSAGFDADARDPLGGCRLTAAGFGKLTKLVRGVADKYAKGRLVSALEGGYNSEAMAEDSAAHVAALMET